MLELLAKIVDIEQTVRKAKGLIIFVGGCAIVGCFVSIINLAIDFRRD